MPQVRFGNTHAISKVPHPDPDDNRLVTMHYDHIKRTETHFDVPPHWVPAEWPKSPRDWSKDETFKSITDEANGVWVHHSAEAPAWVECADAPELAEALRGYYQCGAKPDDWENEVGPVESLRGEIAPGVPVAKTEE